MMICTVGLLAHPFWGLLYGLLPIPGGTVWLALLAHPFWGLRCIYAYAYAYQCDVLCLAFLAYPCTGLNMTMHLINDAYADVTWHELNLWINTLQYFIMLTCTCNKSCISIHGICIYHVYN